MWIPFPTFHNYYLAPRIARDNVEDYRAAYYMCFTYYLLNSDNADGPKAEQFLKDLHERCDFHTDMLEVSK